MSKKSVVIGCNNSYFTCLTFDLLKLVYLYHDNIQGQCQQFCLSHQTCHEIIIIVHHHQSCKTQAYHRHKLKASHVVHSLIYLSDLTNVIGRILNYILVQVFSFGCKQVSILCQSRAESFSGDLTC
jgi:hypothetical protein